MTVKSVDFIVTAKHYSEREGAGGSVRARLKKMQEKAHKAKGAVITMKNIDAPVGQIVKARIWQGQWIADCDQCGGAEFVDASEPIFFCMSCTNRANDHRVRPVEFPKDREEIEALILARPVSDLRGQTDLERVGLAQPVLALETEEGELLYLVRSWVPGETPADLRKQNEIIDIWKENGRQGGGVIKLPPIVGPEDDPKDLPGGPPRGNGNGAGNGIR